MLVNNIIYIYYTKRNTYLKMEEINDKVIKFIEKSKNEIFSILNKTI